MKLPTLLLCGLAAVAQAAPFTPASDGELVQVLPNRLSAAARAQRAELARQPQRLDLALQTARAAIERARRHGDPRELGLAQAALAPWWAQAQAPPAVRLLRAIVLQSQHQFAAALRDLDGLVADGAPDSQVPLALQAQAALTRASVLQVTGRLTEARQACRDLSGPRFASLGAAVGVPAAACVAELRSLTGEPQQAAAALARLAEASPGDPWLALLRAELAERMGDKTAAATRYREALEGTATGDIYSRSAYADFLLDQGRNQEALALVEAGEPAQMDADAMQLRRVIALHRLQRPAASAAAQALQARFEAAKLRGENYHGREQARFALEVLGRPESALQWALSNWAQQKEPADALLLQRAAVAAGRPAAAEPVQRLVQQTGWVDRRLVQ